MTEARRNTGYISLTLKYPTERLTTSRPITEEIFSTLEYMSEVEEIGLQLIQKHGHKGQRKQKRVFNQFQAFIRQGKAFYKGAEAMEYRAAPLYYYYSFLNLAKAVLSLSNPDVVGKRISHGLIHRHRSIDFDKQTVEVSTGVFPHLYRRVLGDSVKKGLKLNISRLFGYITDISYEYSLVDYGPKMFCRGMYKILIDDSRNSAWPLFAIQDSDQINPYKKYFSSFRQYTQKVTLQKQRAKEMFGLDASVMRSHGFFESKSEYELNKRSGTNTSSRITKDCQSAIGYAYSQVSVPADYDHLIFMPYRPKNQISFESLLASYVIMFYLGSLVRYYPHYLEELMSSKHAWIIERFTTCSGILFLRELSKLLNNKVLLYSTY